MSTAVIHRYGFDDVRRFAAALGTAVGLPSTRSLALASHLLWFDAVGAPSLGIATLPSWMEVIERRQVNPAATGRMVSERTALAVFDGENGPTPLVLERAGEIAVEKSRESGVGLVRVIGAGSVRSAAPVAAAIAVGPTAGWVLGPDRCWSMALPSQGGLPLVVDSGISESEASENSVPAAATGRRGSAAPKTARSVQDGPPSVSTLLEGFWLGTELLLPEGGWLVAAASIPALESFATFHERLSAVADGRVSAPGRLLPEAWEARRREARQTGIVVEASAWKSLAQSARRLLVDVPDPLDD